ncbi:hypothetical protein O3G_MSEX008519 [Manduca sexta]|uniref:CCHC-type domain-containing protein n=1 Tax=Manduca sexta TaxID=7130 RepID=A0A922CQ55_MANSE|nr:hypothetical protein O3G_MSEX008519 [Manduca sexta]
MSRMKEPPDPGGVVPEPSQIITVNTASSMDSDCSASNVNKRKRTRLHRICKICNKKKRNNEMVIESGKRGCCCVDSDEKNSSDPSPYSQVLPTPVVPSTLPIVPDSLGEVGRKQYSNSDAAPFVVHIVKSSEDTNKDVSFHPICFGRFLHKYQIDNFVLGSVKRIGRNKISMAFSNCTSANTFFSHTALTDKGYEAYIPTFHITRMGLVRGIPCDMSLSEVKENIRVPLGCGEIIKVRRLNYKSTVDGTVTWKPSQTVVLTFDGQVLPTRIFMCYNALKVELYIYPTIQCFNCCRYGHTKTSCSSSSSCLCGGQHFGISKSCPEATRQSNIKIYMAQNCVSYSEESKIHPPVVKSYADTLKFTEAPSLNAGTEDFKHPFTPSPHNKSYKKTVFQKPRPPPKPGKGYESAAHQALVSDYNSHFYSNGCALPSKADDLNCSSLESQPLIDLVISLIESLSHTSLPSYVAPLFNKIIQLISNNGSHEQHPTMELPKCNSK